MAGLCEGGNEPAGSLKAIYIQQLAMVRRYEKIPESRNYRNSAVLGKSDTSFKAVANLAVKFEIRNTSRTMDEIAASNNLVVICRAMHDGASKVSGCSGQHLWSVQFREIQPECIPELINSFLVAFRDGSSKATVTRLILNALVSVFEMFHTSPNTAGDHAHISVCMLKPEVNFNGRFSVFKKKFNDSTLSKRIIVVDHFENIACDHVLEANDVIICQYIVTDRLDTATCTHSLLSTDVHIRTDHVRYTLRYLHCFSVVFCPHPSDSALNGILIFSVDGIGDIEMIFDEMRPKIRYILPYICITVGENLGKNLTSNQPKGNQTHARTQLRIRRQAPQHRLDAK
ncbi:hypothetical protein ANN_19996 [Periplaneta americana]|uniref:Uncharacterized protein n=1 Tax=Periplaneta americana TaxID=6978 RepID=A0ABQ8SBE4_PERAM|nr:hypothetical protein ANN_19996 [Periplaneta americana]